MAQSHTDRWIDDLKSVHSCIANFIKERPKSEKECRYAAMKLEHNLDLLHSLSLKKFPLKWFNIVVNLREQYPLAIVVAYRTINAFDKLAAVGPKEMTVDESQTCTICLEELDGAANARKVPACSHMYHADCIFQWLYKHRTCPICRGKLN